MIKTLIILGILALYFLPLWVALSKRAPILDVVGVGLWNLLLGWTLIGWVIFLFYAASFPHRPSFIPIDKPPPKV